MNYESARHNMIQQQLRPWYVADSAVIERFYAVRREDFVPDAYRALAFADVEVPVVQGKADACLLPPKLEGRIMQALAVQPGERVLEIGAGSGHLAALLAGHAKEVVSIEIDPAIAAVARANLDRAGVDTVRVEIGDGLADRPEQTMFDAIVISGGVTEIPQSLIDRLAPGGRLAAFVALPRQAPTLALRLLKRVDATAVTRTDVLETVVPMLQRNHAAQFAF